MFELKEVGGVSVIVDQSTWKMPGFNAAQVINNLSGPIIEVGGPTPGGYKLVDFRDIDKELCISNFHPGKPRYHPLTGDRIGYAYRYRSLQFLADARRLPFQDESVSAVFAANIERTQMEVNKKQVPLDKQPPLRAPFFHEAARVLQPGGLFVYKGGVNLVDFTLLFDLNLKQVQYQSDNVYIPYQDRDIIERSVYLILQKPA